MRKNLHYKVKNLHYKVLASVLAIAGLYFYNAPAAWAAIQQVDRSTWIGNGTITNNGNDNNDQIQEGASVYGWHINFPNSGDSSKKANNNEIKINYSTLAVVSGGKADSDNADNNKVTINNGNIRYIYGGHSATGSASYNNILIEGNGNVFYYVAGGDTNSGVATGNKVIITGNVTANSYIAGGVGNANGNTLSGNQVIIQSGTVTGNIYGGYAEQYHEASIHDNDITIKGSADITEANLYGGYAPNSSIAEISNNTLTLDGWSGTANSINKFQNIEFKNIAFNNNSVLNLTNDTVQSDLSDVENIAVSNFAGGQKFSEGDTFTLIGNASNSGITAQNFKATAGVTADVGGVIEQNGNDVVMKVNSVQLNSQTKLVAQTRAASAAFINQGTDLISDSLDTLSRDGNYGVKTFAAVHGNRTLKLLPPCMATAANMM